MLTFEDLIARIRHLLWEKPHFRYRPIAIKGGCSYSRSKPLPHHGPNNGCLLGQAIFQDEEYWQKYQELLEKGTISEGYCPIYVLLYKLGIKYTMDQVRLLERLQSEQDQGTRWGSLQSILIFELNRLKTKENQQNTTKDTTQGDQEGKTS